MIKREYHGLRQTSEYKIWAGIKQRCRNPKNPNYARYGGAGIAMCDEWANSFTAFLNAVGPRPSLNHSIDRLDGAKGYDSKNCRWATDREQAQNQSTTRFITFGGLTLCLSEWSRRTGIPLVTLWSRFESGKTPEQAFNTSKPGLFWNSKMLEGNLESIRARAASGETGKSIAKSLGIHHTTACRIISGRTFKRITKAIALAQSEGM